MFLWHIESIYSGSSMASANIEILENRILKRLAEITDRNGCVVSVAFRRQPGFPEYATIIWYTTS